MTTTKARPLIEIARELVDDLHSGWIANESHRADVHRRRLEDELRAAIAREEAMK